MKKLILTKELKETDLKNINVAILGHLKSYLYRAINGSINYKIGKDILKKNYEVLENKITELEKI